MCLDLWITSLLFDLNREFINGSFAFSPGQIYILTLLQISVKLYEHRGGYWTEKFLWTILEKTLPSGEKYGCK